MKEEDLHLDGNPKLDRPLIVQFCANDPSHLLAAAKLVQPFCDAVDLNLGCPQGIARRGHYGAFLQEDQQLVYKLINTLHKELDIPVTAKCRILDTREKTLAYVKMLYEAGASIVTVHGRRREMKGHATGLADWSTIRWLRERLPRDRVLFANGNVLQHGDLQRCLDATGADAVMTAEGNLHDPGIFTNAEVEKSVEYKGFADFHREIYYAVNAGPCGYRIDAVMRRYFDIIYTHVLGQDPPERTPLFIIGDPGWKRPDGTIVYPDFENLWNEEQGPESKNGARKSRADKKCQVTDPNLTGMQAHLFNLLRPLLSIHTPIRDALARCRAGDIQAFENILAMVERATKEGVKDGWWNPENYLEIWDEKDEVQYEVRDPRYGTVRPWAEYEELDRELRAESREEGILRLLWVRKETVDDPESSEAARKRCRRPWWVCQPYVRPLPKEALAKGSLTVGKKEKEKMSQANGNVEGVLVEEMAIDNVADEGPRQELVCG
jgi:tRNA-dihydrouridine synthase 1